MSAADGAAGPAPRPARRGARLERSTRPLILGGNRLQLLEGGDAYFPQLVAAIDAARRSVHLETYIYADDAVGERVAAALTRAAARGVATHLAVDGFGTGDHAARLAARLRPHGVQVAIYRPARWWRLQRRELRRLHRKLAVVDGRLAFIGGINILDDRHHPGGDDALGPRYDYAVRCEGPVVGAIALAMQRLARTLALLAGGRRVAERAETVPPAVGHARAALLLRDNLRHRRTIESAYLDAIGAAHARVTIACAYFFPGRRFRAALVAAARRGVRVVLLVQGRIEYALQHYAQEALYGQLIAAGVEIHEYEPSFLHAKVAVVDGAWATVGSSNIDPYSLLLAREANLAVHDAAFAHTLTASLDRALVERARRVDPQRHAGRGWFRRLLNWSAYAVVRLGAVVLAGGGRDY